MLLNFYARKETINGYYDPFRVCYYRELVSSLSLSLSLSLSHSLSLSLSLTYSLKEIL